MWSNPPRPARSRRAGPWSRRCGRHGAAGSVRHCTRGNSRRDSSQPASASCRGHAADASSAWNCPRGRAREWQACRAPRRSQSRSRKSPSGNSSRSRVNSARTRRGSSTGRMVCTCPLRSKKGARKRDSMMGVPALLIAFLTLCAIRDRKDRRDSGAAWLPEDFPILCAGFPQSWAQTPAFHNGVTLFFHHPLRHAPSNSDSIALRRVALRHRLQNRPTIPIITSPAIRRCCGAAIPFRRRVRRRGCRRRSRRPIAFAGLPYKWGGGHGCDIDSGYDCLRFRLVRFARGGAHSRVHGFQGFSGLRRSRRRGLDQRVRQGWTRLSGRSLACALTPAGPMEAKVRNGRRSTARRAAASCPAPGRPVGAANVARSSSFEFSTTRKPAFDKRHRSWSFELR